MGQNKVLLITASYISRGGVETFLANWISQASSEYEFTWYYPYRCVDESCTDEFIKKGVSLICGGMDYYNKSTVQKVKNYFRINGDIKRILKQDRFVAVHVNTGSIITNVIALRLAKKNNIWNRIGHSHSADALTVPPFKRMVYGVLRKSINNNVTKRVACSLIAGESLFGKKYINNTLIINNGVDINKFAFSEESRKNYRKKYNIQSCFVIGEVGMLCKDKNQIFLVDIFKQIYEKDSACRLMLVGTGSDEERIKQHVQDLGLQNVVIFVGQTFVPEKFYCAMDVFVLPSTMEGLSFALIEAQTSGLSCIVSNGNSKESNITGNCKFLSLNDPVEIWVDEILACKSYDIQSRYSTAEIVERKNYSLSHYKSFIDILYK